MDFEKINLCEFTIRNENTNVAYGPFSIKVEGVTPFLLAKKIFEFCIDTISWANLNQSTKIDSMVTGELNNDLLFQYNKEVFNIVRQLIINKRHPYKNN